MVAPPRLIVAPQPHLVNDEQWATRWAPKHHADDIRICRCGCRRDRRVLCLLGSRAQWRVGDLAGPGAASLILFAWLLTHADVAFAGRAYAVYGGIYIAASLLWLWGVEGRAPDRWDAIGAAVAIAGAMINLYAPRTS
jgi:drug/metabolite transporter superfamily protein YnfA